MNLTLEDIRDDIVRGVADALNEDIGSGDITALLIPETQTNNATIITREDCIICGIEWVNETFKQLDDKLGERVTIDWHVKEGDLVQANTALATLAGPSRTLLTGERTALNFLQLLSGVATKAHTYAKTLGDSNIHILDTRKTLPGLRLAQKYAVATGGCHNHRIGLYDAFLIKENHIAAAGGISEAVSAARKIAPDKKVEVETESLEELTEAINAGADIAMLDNFSEKMLTEALALERKSTKFEISGNLNLENLTYLKGKKIDYCSFGDLTKNVKVIDLSMRLG